MLEGGNAGMNDHTAEETLTQEEGWELFEIKQKIRGEKNKQTKNRNHHNEEVVLFFLGVIL